jgi:GTPase Era involved in 16S rRNA processing
LKGDGIADLKRYLLDTAKPNNFDFPSVVYTDEDPRHTVKKIVKAKFLDVIPSDVPYKINPVIQTWC